MTASDPIDPRPDLGARGVVAVLTPAGNPTAEPELSVLMPPDVNLLTARMHCTHDDMSERLRAYGRGLTDWLAPFGDTPLDAVAFACTGSTYLLEPEDRPASTVERTEGNRPIVCAADAVEAALADLAAQRIVLVSPYPASLTATAVDYWRGCGFEIAVVLETPAAPSGHPIYSKTAASLLATLRTTLLDRADAVVVLGTGAPSLPALAVASLETDTPILSSNLCTAWGLVSALAGQAEPIRDWLSPSASWRDRLWSRFPTVRDRLS